MWDCKETMHVCVQTLSQCVYLCLQTLVPAVDWMPYLTEVFAPVPLNESEPVVVYAKEYLQQVSDLITKTNKRSVSLYALIVFPFMHQTQAVHVLPTVLHTLYMHKSSY